MKRFMVLLAILTMVSMAAPVMAMGPLMVSAHQFFWDREADSGGMVISGYYIYWRAPVASGPVNPWVNTQRSPMVPQSAVGVIPTLDALTLNLPNGSYEWCATAVDTNGDESGPSNIVPLALAIPAFPANLRKQ